MLDNVRRHYSCASCVAYGTADVATLAINILLLPLYTRVLSPREYGAFALLIVFEGFLKPVFRWGLDTAYVRFYYDQATEHGRRTLAGTITIFLTVVNGVLLLCFLLAAPAINQWLLDTDAYVTAFLLLVVNSFVSNVLFLPLGLLRIQERAPRLAALNFSRALGTILLRILFVLVLRLSVLGLFMADLIATLVLLGWLGGTFRSMIELRFSMSSLRPLLRFGFPQLPHGLLSQTMALFRPVRVGSLLPAGTSWPVLDWCDHRVHGQVFSSRFRSGLDALRVRLDAPQGCARRCSPEWLATSSLCSYSSASPS